MDIGVGGIIESEPPRGAFIDRSIESHGRTDGRTAGDGARQGRGLGRHGFMLLLPIMLLLLPLLRRHGCRRRRGPRLHLSRSPNTECWLLAPDGWDRGGLCRCADGADQAMVDARGDAADCPVRGDGVEWRIELEKLCGCNDGQSRTPRPIFILTAETDPAMCCITSRRCRSINYGK